MLIPMTYVGKERAKGHYVEDYDMDCAINVNIPLFYGCWFDENDHGEVDNLFENDLINA
jgi:NADPH-dependent glutamate synthase beta subunit-like oxidoreductase